MKRQGTKRVPDERNTEREGRRLEAIPGICQGSAFGSRSGEEAVAGYAGRRYMRKEEDGNGSAALSSNKSGTTDDFVSLQERNVVLFIFYQEENSEFYQAF